MRFEFRAPAAGRFMEIAGVGPAPVARDRGPGRRHLQDPGESVL